MNHKGDSENVYEARLNAITMVCYNETNKGVVCMRMCDQVNIVAVRSGLI
jgi:hypothetical protein